MCPVKSRNGNYLRAAAAAVDSPPGHFHWAADEMTLGNQLGIFVLVVLAGSSQTRGQASALPPVFTPAAPTSHADLPEDPFPSWKGYLAGRDEASSETTATTRTKGVVGTETVTNVVFKTHSLSTSSAVVKPQHTTAVVVATTHPSAASSTAAAAGGGLSSAPTPQSATPSAESRTLPTPDPPAVPSMSSHTAVEDASSTGPTSEPQATHRPFTSAGPPHREVPSQLNVGGEDVKQPRQRSSSPLDPLLAALLSVFIVTTAIVFVALFLKFRQGTNHPEFHRLQDLPMDDLMEDTPLARYTY